MILAGKDGMSEPLTKRRELLRDQVLAKLDEPIRESTELEASRLDLIASVKASGPEGYRQRLPVAHSAAASSALSLRFR
jgi:hypothetical protein